MLARLPEAPPGLPRRLQARLAILRIRDLQPHEGVEPTRLLRVAWSIASRGAVLRPIIVEEESLTVIDGPHRLEALRLLGARYAPVALAAYGREITGILAPRRTIPAPAASAGEALEWIVGRLEPLLEPGPSRLTLRAGGQALELRASKASIYKALETLARASPRTSQAWSVRAEPEPLTPGEILEAARRDARLPPRSSYHVTPLKNLYAPTKLARLL